MDNLKTVEISKEDFPNKLKKTREELDISQRELAKRAGISPATVSFLERGLRDPTLGILCAIGAVLGVLFLINVFSKKGSEQK